MSLTRHEKETIILFNEEEPTARVETFNGRIIREAEKAATKSSDVICEERSEGYGVYTLPKTFVKIRGTQNISDEVRKRMSEHCKSIGANAIKTHNKV